MVKSIFPLVLQLYLNAPFKKSFNIFLQCSSLSLSSLAFLIPFLYISSFSDKLFNSSVFDKFENIEDLSKSLRFNNSFASFVIDFILIILKYLSFLR